MIREQLRKLNDVIGASIFTLLLMTFLGWAVLGFCSVIAALKAFAF